MRQQRYKVYHSSFVSVAMTRPRGHNLLYAHSEQQTSLKWYSTIAVLSGTLAPAGTFLKNTDKICAADCANCADIMQVVLLLCKL